MLRYFSLLSLYSFLPSLLNSENRLGPGYFRAGGLKGHASLHPIGRRLPCHSCSNSVEHPHTSQRGFTIQLLQQCGAPTHIGGFTILPSSFFQGAPATDTNISRTHENSTPRAGDNINTKVSQTAS